MWEHNCVCSGRASRSPEIQSNGLWVCNLFSDPFECSYIYSKQWRHLWQMKCFFFSFFSVRLLWRSRRHRSSSGTHRLSIVRARNYFLHIPFWNIPLIFSQPIANFLPRPVCVSSLSLRQIVPPARMSRTHTWGSLSTSLLAEGRPFCSWFIYSLPCLPSFVHLFPLMIWWKMRLNDQLFDILPRSGRLRVYCLHRAVSGQLGALFIFISAFSDIYHQCENNPTRSGGNWVTFPINESDTCLDPVFDIFHLPHLTIYWPESPSRARSTAATHALSYRCKWLRRIKMPPVALLAKRRLPKLAIGSTRRMASSIESFNGKRRCWYGELLRALRACVW